jgi:hypothetical protein
LEASEYSDIDLFFFCCEDREKIIEPRSNELRLFADIIRASDELKFPKFSNDCQYLQVLHTSEMFRSLGSSLDDHRNFFTARMLMLLESRCLYGQDTYEKIKREIIESYFRDFSDHKHSFEPIFLLNDISRFWKTMLLNYEARRNLQTSDAEARHRVRNYKLKHSRMTTCFATIASIGSLPSPVTFDDVFECTQWTPFERLAELSSRLPSTSATVTKIGQLYERFLENTALPTEELEDKFKDKTVITKLFQEAREYGDAMFELLGIVDKETINLGRGLLRFLVI